MKRFHKILLLLAITLAFTSGLLAKPSTDYTRHGITAVTQTKVYVCLSANAVAYHGSSSCRGLNRCTHQIKSVTKSTAINTYGLRACRICY